MSFADLLSARQSVISDFATKGVDLGVSQLAGPAQRIVDRLIVMDGFIPQLLAVDGENPGAVMNAVVGEVQARYEAEKKASADALYQIQLKRFYSHHPSPDDPVPPYLPGHTGLSDLIEIRYLALCKLAFARNQIGAWPLVVGDLLNDVEDSNVLLIQSVSDVLEQHPDVIQIIARATDESVVRMAAGYRQLAVTLKQREYREIAAGVLNTSTIEKIAKVADWALRVAGIYDLAERVYRSAVEAVQRTQAEHEIRELQGGGERLEGAEDHVDAFERNRDELSRTC